MYSYISYYIYYVKKKKRKTFRLVVCARDARRSEGGRSIALYSAIVYSVREGGTFYNMEFVSLRGSLVFIRLF